jgi:hypothetical protein
MAALTVLVVDSVISRVPAMSNSLSRTVARLAVGGGLAYYTTEKTKLPTVVPLGIVSGVVLASILDVGTNMIAQQRPQEPPLLPANAVLALGSPWPPRRM